MTMPQGIFYRDAYVKGDSPLAMADRWFSAYTLTGTGGGEKVRELNVPNTTNALNVNFNNGNVNNNNKTNAYYVRPVRGGA